MNDSLEGIAVIGMSARFPGANDVSQFWQNLRDGVESISRFSPQELQAAGLSPTVFNHPLFVNAGGIVPDIDLFDASFFGFNPREAEILDPQQRLFMECAWNALEDAGYVTEKYDGTIGVYAGSGMSSYLFNIISNHEVMAMVGSYSVLLGNDKDHLATHVSYKLNLKGPSVAVQSACSTSLVAVCMACQSLLDHQCDIALAGGVSIKVPQKAGYMYQEGMINSPDGHCRSFDAKAKGTVGGNGLGIVVLKRLQDAVADGDFIRAVIKGFAINNDGSLKVGYTAPSVEGQAEVIAMAQTMAEVNPETISYVEAHGTATPLGDPIEIAALTQAFRASTKRKGFCAIGSVKSNIGHLDPAAGIAGFIKTVLMLEHKQLPPSLHFTHPNPQIDFANSPFFVNNRLLGWKDVPTPRRAGVSSFGIGGTNAHVILEEAPKSRPSGPGRSAHLLLLSARTKSALATATINLARYLRQASDISIADIAYTSQIGRRDFEYRRALVCHDLDDAVNALESQDPRQILTAVRPARDRRVVFMFSGQGAQYVNMAHGLYRHETTFREHVDRCAEILKPYLGLNVLEVLYPRAEETETKAQHLQQTAITQPALFTIEYALARLWMAWGVHPAAMIGHSIGEYVAACLAGVLSLEDALALVVARGALMQSMPAGGMLAVSLPQSKIEAFLGKDLDLAVINGPSQCVASGPIEAIKQLQSELSAKGVAYRLLHTSHAFHSRMMDPMLEAFQEEVKKVPLHPPRVHFISNLTGTWITAEMVTDPVYWVKQLRHTVRFADGIGELLKDPDACLLEVGPGSTLNSLAHQHPGIAAGHSVLSSVRHLRDRQPDVDFIVQTLSHLWLAGVEVDWAGFHSHEQCKRVPLPTYPFERQRYWIGPHQPVEQAGKRPPGDKPARNIEEWFYSPSWNLSSGIEPRFDSNEKLHWLLFGELQGLGARLMEWLRHYGQSVTFVTTGKQFARLDQGRFSIDPHRPEDYSRLLKEVRAESKLPNRIIHLWGIAAGGGVNAEAESFDHGQYLGFYSLLFLSQALAQQKAINPVKIGVVTNSIYLVTGEEALQPEKATVLGPCKVIPQEYPNIRCQNIDIAPVSSGGQPNEELLAALIAEVHNESSDTVVAYRGNQRWLPSYNPIRLDAVTGSSPLIRQGGVYLITGGLGNIGLLLAEDLAKRAHTKLILLGRSTFPQPESWSQWLKSHGELDNISRKIRKLQAIERSGSQLLILSGDVANEKQMREVVSQALTRFGAINGVIHGAGNTSAEAFSYINQTDRKLCESHFDPKARGLTVMNKVLDGTNPDFFILLSSLSSVLGGLGFVAYAAANCFMDAFASERKKAKTTRWISINWDGWQFMPGSNDAASWSDASILPNEGQEAFGRILSANSPGQVIVSINNLQARIKQWIKLETVQKSQQGQKPSTGALHPRPDLPTSYVAPANETELTIAGIWQELLGVQQVGIHDSFFELGGHSLLAIQVVSRLSDIFHTELSVQTLFDSPTVAQLAEKLKPEEQQQVEDAEEIEKLLEMVEHLSDSEVEELLSKHQGLQGG